MLANACPGCHELLAPFDGPTHRYIGASPACWNVYGKFLATESTHPLAVDAYAAQHPGTPSPQAVQSVAIHLVTIEAVLHEGFQPDRASAIRTAAVEAGRRDDVVYEWMTPAPTAWGATLHDVERRKSTQEEWVESVRDGWWEIHGDLLSKWARFVVSSI